MCRVRIGRLDTRAEGGEPQKLGTNSLKSKSDAKLIQGSLNPAWQDFCTWARFGTHFIYRVRIGKLVPNFGGKGPRAEGGRGKVNLPPILVLEHRRVGGFCCCTTRLTQTGPGLDRLA